MERDIGIAVVFAVLGLSSAVVSTYRWTRLARRRVVLVEENVEHEAGQSNIQAGVFDIARPDDFIDGHPIDEVAFWARIRPQKIALLVVLAAVVSTAFRPSGRWGHPVSEIQTGFNAYLAFLAILSLRTSNRAAHAASSSMQIFNLVLYLAASALAIITPRGPCLQYPLSKIYPQNICDTTNSAANNVNGVVDASALGALFFVYISKTAVLPPGFGVSALPILTVDMRALVTYSRLRASLRNSHTSKVLSGLRFGLAVIRANAGPLVGVQLLATLTAAARYAPSYFMRLLLLHLEHDRNSDGAAADKRWGYIYVAGLFVSGLVSALGWGQLWNLSHIAGIRIISQTTSILFAKTLVRKDTVVAASAEPKAPPTKTKKNDDAPFAHKGRILTLMSQDVHRVANLSRHVYTLTDSPVQLILGTWLLYSLLGISCFVGFAAALVCLPLQHFAGKIIIRTQSALMRAKDERIGLTNEIFGGIRMIKFMGWERNFEARLWGIREKELARQKITYTMKTVLVGVGNFIPLLSALASFGHYTVIRHRTLTPSIAFTAVGFYSLPNYTVDSCSYRSPVRLLFNHVPFHSRTHSFQRHPICLLWFPPRPCSTACRRSFVSLRRIDQYLDSPEVTLPISAPSSRSHANTNDTRIFLSTASITWPSHSHSSTYFALSDLSLNFPAGELSLVCGKVGSGKSLLLLALLGEADVTAGHVVCPRSAPDFLATCAEVPSSDDWVVAGVCAYVPQTSWLRNQSIRDNILFELPYCAERYEKTLEVLFNFLHLLGAKLKEFVRFARWWLIWKYWNTATCRRLASAEQVILFKIRTKTLIASQINLSGGQKARVSLARAVYSRASILILDDILSAVDVHTATHIYHYCLKGDIMHGRTVILVSHHIQLCADGAAYIVALDQGRTEFQGGPADFRRSDAFRRLLQTRSASTADEPDTPSNLSTPSPPPPTLNSTASKPEKAEKTGKAPKFVTDEVSSLGRIPWAVWTTYLGAVGNGWYWLWFSIILLVACLGPVFENGYLRIWADAGEAAPHGPTRYLLIYAAILCMNQIFQMAHFLALYSGSIRASRVLYRKLLETVLFTTIRFHDTVARGNLLNRFGKDLQIIDVYIADDFGRTLKLGLSAFTTFATITVVGGLPFLGAASVLGLVYYFLAKDYAHTSRDMRRLVSTTTSPLYSIYDTAISGVLVIRAFGGSTTFLRDLMRFVDVNSCACHWQYGLNRWFSVVSMAFGGTIVALIGLVVLLTPAIDPSLAGMALTFASMLALDVMYFVRAFVGLEQCLVAVERVKETSDLVREPPEIIEPRPPANWPSEGKIVCQDLAVRYAPDLPDVLHNINFQVLPGEKIGVVGRTGSGKSTLALSFFRFVEASAGKLVIDDIDIASLGLTDLRRNLTIIPQDPTLMSGTLRSTLNVFGKYQDAEIFEALRRVHLISDSSKKDGVFHDLDSPVSQAGGNFSAGEKQLLCMARAILKHSKVLIIDEATASVDYATDELIGVTIREIFSSSTVIAIAHRLRSIIDYDKVMVLEEGCIVEFDRPKTLLENPTSVFYGMCKATGTEEFATLRSMAGV
ncbi:Multidrug resistance-associated ABC transporter [Mycena venus]|uniref:Multidrug resistance-associated ABC transporter n=1 Tax=Mycena venus TaxID=2733690 RepID=A0A8H6Z1Q8_9AGAR|nr:Multidrug resistance-associated ABC transporter [Mycena venus]